MVCKSHNNIYDRIVEVISEELLDLSCQDYGSNEFTERDYEEKCPKSFGGIIKEDEQGIIIIAD